MAQLSRFDVRRELLERDGFDLATACAALQLLPANASHLDRLCALAATALSSGTNASLLATEADLARWLISGPSLHRGPRWDPYEGPFAEPIDFYGGGYLLQTGGNAEAVFNLRTLLNAVFAPTEPLGNRDFSRRLSQFTRSVLMLATHACLAGHVTRWAPAEDTKVVLIAPVAVMPFLRAGVRFTRAELMAITNANPDVLEPIIHDMGTLGPPALNTNGTQFNARPLLRFDDTYLLVEPGTLALALRHAIVSLSLAQGLRAELTERLALTSMVFARTAGERMNWVMQHEHAAKDAPIVSVLGGFDTDKAVDIAIVYEDFDGYSDVDPESVWSLKRWEPALVRHLRNVEERLMQGPIGERPNEILHLVIVAGCGRPHAIGVPSGALLMPHLPTSLENFHQVGMGTLDPLRLWKFVCAGERLRTYSQTLAFSMLDEYAAWGETESYYFGDDGRPTFVSFDADHGRAYLEKVASDTDVHGVIAPRGHWTEVVRLHAAPHIPIYGLLNDSGRELLMLVEGPTSPIWVTAADVAPDARKVYFDLVDCIAYWLWQATPSLPDLAAIGTPRLVIEVALSEPEAWVTGHPMEPNGEVADTRSTSDGVLRITAHSAMLPLLDSPDNAAERALLHALLSGIDSLLPTHSRLGGAALTAAVERHAPLGIKKKMNVFRADNEIALVGDRLPRYRPISRADTEQLLDEAGEHLAVSMKLPMADIPTADKTKVLNEIVTFHYSQLEREVSQLSPTGLLEQLIGMHETTIHHEATERRTLGARVAAFGDTELLDRMRRALPEATQSSIALRFLIKYVTARPPRGLRPFSMAGFDRLLAIAGQIVSRGLTSDVIHFKIDDPGLSYLASRRLGLSDAGVFQSGQQSFLDAMIPAHARALIASYDAPWRTKPASEPPEVEEIDRASSAEWGFSMTELLGVFSALSAIAHERGGVAVSMLPNELRAHLKRTLGWTDAHIGEVIDLLVLRPRSDFTTPPDGFSRYELWPWRFNRRLSYMRRPLLLRPGADGDEVVWGMRQPEQAGRFLVDLVTSERLNAISSEMKQLMTRLRQAETAAFAETVADVCRERQLLVDTCVRKIAGERMTRANGEDISDVDVLAIDIQRSTIYALECKDLEVARTPAELDNELRHTFRTGGRKRSAAQKHQERVAWLADRVSRVLAGFGIEDATTGWVVEGAIVTDVNVMSPHLATCPLPVYALHELKVVLDERHGASHLSYG
jgi:hypothetical protein